jgi:hypothetical protein
MKKCTAATKQCSGVLAAAKTGNKDSISSYEDARCSWMASQQHALSWCDYMPDESTPCSSEVCKQVMDLASWCSGGSGQLRHYQQA